jgi:hypothetical protein
VLFQGCACTQAQHPQDSTEEGKLASTQIHAFIHAETEPPGFRPQQTRVFTPTHAVNADTVPPEFDHSRQHLYLCRNLVAGAFHSYADTVPPEFDHSTTECAHDGSPAELAQKCKSDSKCQARDGRPPF